MFVFRVKLLVSMFNTSEKQKSNNSLFFSLSVYSHRKPDEHLNGCTELNGSKCV